jgi:hypothetical protein
MTDAELEAERLALLAEERDLDQAHQRLHLTPDDRPAHAAHRERLKAHAARARALRDAIRLRTWGTSRCSTSKRRRATCKGDPRATP